MLTGKTIGFLGAGSMAEALIKGLKGGGVVQPEQIGVVNRANRERLESLSRRFGIRAFGSKARLVAASDVLVIACKPKDVGDLLAEVGHLMRPGQVLLSVVAGVSTAFVAASVTPGVELVRAMPNTSCQVGESATAICLGQGSQEVTGQIAKAILGAVGEVVEVPEPLIDAVTGLSGSGPAYVYLMIEAMMEAGRSVGLPEEVARTLAIQTLMGAARMLVETGEDPALLRQRVTSPGGTTMAGLQALQEAGFRQAVVTAVSRATQRSRELGALAAAPRIAMNG